MVRSSPHTGRLPVIASIPMDPETRVIPKIDTRISNRRSNRSVTDPATNPTTRLGAERAANTAPTIAPDPVISKTSQPNSTCCMPCPSWLDTVEIHSTRKSRYLRAANNCPMRDRLTLRCCSLGLSKLSYIQ